MNNFGEYLNKYTSGKAVCILGFGREGKSTYRMLKKHCSCGSLTIADLNLIDREANELPDEIKLICGEKYQSYLSTFDIVFKSPGIVLESEISELECEITCETQLFFEFFRSQIIGITGTKGKSTCSSLIYHILKESGIDCRLAGNIGIPVFDIAETVTDKTVIVCELSCHQLEYMTVSPTDAVFLNLYEEHLDHYGTMENYYNAKKNIYLHQKKHDCLLINSNIAPECREVYDYTISAEDPSANIYVHNGIIKIEDHEDYKIPVDRIKLLGIHNHYNIAVAYFMTSFYVEREEFEKALCTFDPLAHRLEFVDKINGIFWYDDSISTACATAIEALKSVPNPDTILIGGMDRGIDYTELIDYLSECDVNVICMEFSGKRIFDNISEKADFRNHDRIHYVQHLDEAVRLASEITEKGKSCVLSPASASYGIFKNFEERGDAFKKLVAEMEKKDE